MLHPLFPCKITYPYTLGYQDNHTDFTLSTVSNHPTLRIHNMNQGRPYNCNGYLLNGIDRLFLNEKMFSSHSGKNVYYTNSGFKEVIYDKKSAIFQEQFDGDNVSHSVQFNIKFDDYKSSWHYNLLEFQDNLYAAIITTTKGEYVLCGFGFGLQPSYTVTSDGEMTPDHIEIRLVDMHDNGDLFTFITGGTISPNDDRVYNYTTKYDAWECVSDGYAKYLLQEEFDVLGNPTGHYKCLEGYEERFAFLGDALIGTFNEVVTFYQPQCKASGCTLSTSLTSTVKMFAQQCTMFTVKADSDWSITNSADYLQITPTSGSGGTTYSVQLCNFRPQSAETVTTSFTINYCSTAQTYTVQVGKGNGCFYGGDSFEIGAEGQYVTIPTQCCIDSALETTSALTNIQIFDTYIKVYVPQNLTESARTFTLDVTLCDGTDSEVTITQTNAYTRWVKESEVCVGTQLCDVERMYSGTTPDNINTWTSVWRRNNCQESDRCAQYTTRWVETEETVCYMGKKYIVEAEQVKYSTDSDWINTGNKRRGSETADSPAECSGTTQYEYQWSATTGYVCSGTNKMTREIYQRRISGSSDPWENVVPTQERAAQPMIESASTDCGYVPPVEPIYEWRNISITQDYICDECPEPQYRTLTTGWTCVGVDKYTLAEYQVSVDGGQTWETTGTSATTLIEANSEDCGYVPPTPSLNGKWLATYTAGTTSSAECDSTSAITQNEITLENLQMVEIGDCTTSIGSKAFSGCSSLTSVDIPNSVTSIGNSVFSACWSLSSITIPNSVTSIGGNAFFSCTSLTSITIPDSVTSIGGYAFYYCSGLTSVTIPDSVTSIGNSTFYNCSSLTSVTIPNSVTSIGNQAFVECSSLTSITVDSSNTTYDSRNNCNAIINTSTNELLFGCKNTVIPNDVTTIGNLAFYYCSGLTSVTIPDSVTSIGNNAFGECSGLTTCTIGSSVTSIGDFTFYKCNSLTSITINATTPPTLGNNAFNNTNNCPIYVPSASVSAYKSATNWSTYADRIQAIPNS